MEDRFKSHRNVKCLALEDEEMSFTAFNEQVLAWPDAITSAPLVSGAGGAATDLKASHELEDLI